MAMSAEYRSNLKSAEDRLRLVRGDFLSFVAPGLLDALRALRTGIAEKWHQDFDGWCRRLNVTVHAPPPDCLARVIDAYFEGSPPFKKVKSREDFPDALIAVTLESIYEEVGQLYFITRDEKLRQAVANTGIKCFASMDAFFVATYQDLADRNDDRLFDLLFANVRLLEGEASRHLRTHLRGVTIEAEKLPHDEGEITDAEGVEVFLDLRAAEKLGGGYFRFPFRATASVDIENESGSWTVYGYDDDHEEEERDDEDTTSANIQLSGVLEVHVPFSASADRYAENEQLRRAMHLAEHELLDVEIDEVDVT